MTVRRLSEDHCDAGHPCGRTGSEPRAGHIGAPGVVSSGPQKLTLSATSKGKIVVKRENSLPSAREIGWVRIACSSANGSVSRK